MGTINLKSFSLADYLKAALACAEYEQDDDLIVATVPNVVGFYSQGESHEEARMNLRDAIEGNILIALQMGWEIPQIPGVEIRTEVVATDSCSPTNPGYTRIERSAAVGIAGGFETGPPYRGTGQALPFAAPEPGVEQVPHGVAEHV